MSSQPTTAKGVVIAVINQKGGAGKSSTSIHLADWLRTKQKQQVLLIDSDPQRSSELWVKAMAEPIPLIAMESPDDLLEKMSDLAEQYDYVVVDGPAKLSESTRAILLGADLALIPVQPTGLDLHSAYDAIRLVKQAQKVRGKLPQAAVFLSRAIKGTNLKDETLKALAAVPEVSVLKTPIHQRQVIADAFGQGATVFSMAGRAATDSAREYARLFDEMMELLP